MHPAREWGRNLWYTIFPSVHLSVCISTYLSSSCWKSLPCQHFHESATWEVNSSCWSYFTYYLKFILHDMFWSNPPPFPLLQFLPTLLFPILIWPLYFFDPLTHCKCMIVGLSARVLVASQGLHLWRKCILFPQQLSIANSTSDRDGAS